MINFQSWLFHFWIVCIKMKYKKISQYIPKLLYLWFIIINVIIMEFLTDIESSQYFKKKAAKLYLKCVW